MAYRKATLRRMSPTTRQTARLIGELGSITRRLKLLLPDIQALEQKDMERRVQTENVMKRLTENKKEE